MANRTMAVLINNNASIKPTRHAPSIRIDLAIAEQHGSLEFHFLDAAQTRDDALFVERRVGGADPPAEVRFELADRQRRGYEVQGRRGGETGAVFGEEVERRRPVWLVRVRRREVQGEEGVVD
jgi:hypothetical protein